MPIGHLTEKDEIEARKLLDYFNSKQPELIKEHAWEYALIVDENIPFEFYGTFPVASQEAIKKYGLEKLFLIQQVEPFQPTNFVFNARPPKSA